MTGSPATSTHATAALSACALALALLSGEHVDAERYARELRTPSLAAGDELSAADVTAFDRAIGYLEAAGIPVVRGRTRRAAVHLDPAGAADLEAIAGRQDVLEDLAQILLARAGASRHENAREAHLAAAKLTRDFVISGEPRDLPPTDNKIERTLRDAMALRRQVAVTYRREDGTRVKRVLEPVRHVLYQGDDFLVAAEAGDDRLKTYHYDGFERATLTSVPFTPSPAPQDALFSPPFAFETGRDLPVQPVRFRVGADRVEDAEAAIERLHCGAFFTRTPVPGGSGDEIWEADGASRTKAAIFALRLGIEVLSPAAFRTAYLNAIDAARRAFP